MKEAFYTVCVYGVYCIGGMIIFVACFLIFGLTLDYLVERDFNKLKRKFGIK